jgi:hypothetical protein
MPKFTITESRPATKYWTYEVEAETEEQAIALIMDRYIDPIYKDTKVADDDMSEFNVEEVD